MKKNCCISGTLLFCLMILQSTESGATETTKPDDITATVRRTRYGVVHVKADDFVGAGFGVGYAYATDNHCLLAHRVAQVRGRLAAQLGADTLITTPLGGQRTAIESDRFHLGWFNINTIRAGFDSGAHEVRELAIGYAAGVNRHLAEKPTGEDCQVEFSGDITTDDVYRMWVATADLPVFELLSPYLPNAAPGGIGSAITSPQSLSSFIDSGYGSSGSNAWALGRDVTQDGSAVHFYNPHFPWTGINRLYMIHVTIPGKLDVMGSALGGFPLPLAGFTKDVAWGLTVSAATRFTVAALKLKAGNPLVYSVDGIEENILSELLSIPVLGEAVPRQVPFFRAQTGPLINAPAFFLNWSTANAYAIQDVNQANTRMVEQALRVATSISVNEIRSSLEQVQGNPWSYIIANDVSGNVLFSDISAVPNVSADLIDACNVPVLSNLVRRAGVFLLDGSRSECRWQGRMPPSEQPIVVRSDYVANSNNNYELSNLNAPLSGFSPILGIENQALSLRASLGLKMIQERLDGTDGLGVPGFSDVLAREIFHQDRNLGAEILIDGIVADCEANPTGSHAGVLVNLTVVCNALAGWDRRQTVDSRGAHVFRGLFAALKEQTVTPASLFLMPSSLSRPLDSPEGYTSNAALRQAVRNGLARVALSLNALGISPTARWGDVHLVNTPDGPFGMPGGPSDLGVFDSLDNAVASTSYAGWENSLRGVAPEQLFGTSYLHVVKLTSNGPKAMGLMPYSQATEPGSPWYLDQVAALAVNDWFDFPFTEMAIAADPQLITLQVSSVLPVIGDLDGDGDIDQLDVNRILVARNQAASGVNDPRDLDKNGVINVMDSRKLILLCTRPRCAVN